MWVNKRKISFGKPLINHYYKAGAIYFGIWHHYGNEKSEMKLIPYPPRPGFSN